AEDGQEDWQCHWDSNLSLCGLCSSSVLREHDGGGSVDLVYRHSGADLQRLTVQRGPGRPLLAIHLDPAPVHADLDRDHTGTAQQSRPTVDVLHAGVQPLND